MLYYIILYYIILDYIILYCLHYIALYYIVLSYIMLYSDVCLCAPFRRVWKELVSAQKALRHDLKATKAVSESLATLLDKS